MATQIIAKPALPASTSPKNRRKGVVLKTATPKLPHDRDEAANTTGGVPSDLIQQAHRDVSRGLQDTDRGVETDATYRKLKRPSSP